MRTSLNELKAIEDFLLQRMGTPERLAFEARLLVDAELRQKLAAQKQAYSLVQAYGRKQLRHELDTVHAALFSQPKFQRFRDQIRSFFTHS